MKKMKSLGLMALIAAALLIGCENPSGSKPGDPPAFVEVKGGTFTMGSPTGEKDRDNETQHKVTLTGFYMGRYQVTQKEWLEVMGTDLSKFKGENLPVEQVSWYDAVEYCNKRSVKDGLSPAYTIDKENKDPDNTSNYDTEKWTVTLDKSKNGYRLPTEAEWEYAARGGTTGNSPYQIYAGSNTVGDVAWYEENSNSETHPVGDKKPNSLGLYDMNGNVFEWCWDWYDDYPSTAQTNPTGADSGSYRVSRGGSWHRDASSARSAYRQFDGPFSRMKDVGFRLVRSQ